MKRRAMRKPKTPPAKPGEITKAMAEVGGEDFIAAFRDLTLKEQMFVAALLQPPYTGKAAYLAAFNPNANPNVAYVCASQLLRNPKISKVLEIFKDRQLEAFFRVFSTYDDAMEAMDKKKQPLWAVRLAGAHGMTKLTGAAAPEQHMHKGNVSVTHRYKVPDRRAPVIPPPPAQKKAVPK